MCVCVCTHTHIYLGVLSPLASHLARCVLRAHEYIFFVVWGVGAIKLNNLHLHRTRVLRTRNAAPKSTAHACTEHRPPAPILDLPPNQD